MIRWSLVAAVALLTACAGAGDDTEDASAQTDAAPVATADADVFTPATGAEQAPTDAEANTAAGSDPPTTEPTSTVRSSTSASPASTTSPPTSTTSTTTPPATSTTTLPPVPSAPGALDLSADVVALGASVEGRPIYAERRGTAGGRRALVIGVIHGDEDDGVAIVDDLRSRPVPEGIELWLVESMNPDGRAAQDRHNANEVDLNRNFPYNWGPIGAPGDGQYAGPGPASEPETQAMVNFISQLDPELVIWYHQDLFVINPSTGREGAARARYAELTAWPMGQITGGTYTGIAATWARQQLAPSGGVAFIVELGPTLSQPEAASHAAAVLTLATELPSL